MAEEEAPQEEAPKKGSKKPMLIGLVLMLLLGGGGFFAVYSGLLFAQPPAEDAQAEILPEEIPITPMPDVVFVPIDPLIINVGTGANARHLRFQAQLEVSNTHQGEIETLLPRIVDVFNGYLRAVDPRELEDPAALIRLRAQMLRRVQIVAGEGRVRDVLIMEFVIN
ncbi:Flagellar FliL protein [Aquimixticola soesokkakensis]|uniref:Flagellar protein FliL n=1 Tax=Aquimixticola soesokkakensis TaxID=1519096 RepID=A0A1Y5RC51_9RHOB|nr:flagellar basal body-associated FliL family protein [Aquimixticola soesokkakensis]SLN13177.1 Flagellar FliL protein [Aquimixticola soesokkakensis]